MAHYNGRAWQPKEIPNLNGTACEFATNPNNFENTRIEVLPGHDSKIFDKVLIRPNALEQMRAYVKYCPYEIGWFGTVRTKMLAGGQFYVAIIDEVFLIEQEVHSGETDMPAEGLENFAIKLYEENPEEAGNILANLRLWGHSHVGMKVNPSPTDIDTALQFNETVKNTDSPFMICLIANKRGEVRIDVYHFDVGVVVKDISWSIDTPFIVDEEAILADMKEKVKFSYSGNEDWKRKKRQRQRDEYDQALVEYFGDDWQDAEYIDYGEHSNIRYDKQGNVIRI